MGYYDRSDKNYQEAEANDYWIRNNPSYFPKNIYEEEKKREYDTKRKQQSHWSSNLELKFLDIENWGPFKYSIANTNEIEKIKQDNNLINLDYAREKVIYRLVCVAITIVMLIILGLFLFFKSHPFIGSVLLAYSLLFIYEAILLIKILKDK